MGKSQQVGKRPERRGLLARPLDALVFLLPLLIFYEVASLAEPDRVLAFNLLRQFFELFGHVGMWAPGVAVIVILLATHAASGDAWKIHWGRVGLMYAEAALLAIPLLMLNWAIRLGPASAPSSGMVEDLALGIGAGVYEELVFRLVFISVVVMIGVDLLRLNPSSVAIAAVVLSALAFSAYHHQPIGVEPFAPIPFVFRAIAGVYLAVIFWYRGYGSAAGCHAAYNVALVVTGAIPA